MDTKITCPHCGDETLVSGDSLLDNSSQTPCPSCGKEIQKENIDNFQQKTMPSKDFASTRIKLPERIGMFHSLRHLASGGMGDVFLAKLSGAAGFEREVILKVLHPHLARNQRFVQTMIDEAKITVLLHHPNIVQMYTLEKTDDFLFCVMEYVPGKTLADIQKDYKKKLSPLPIPMSVYITIQTLEGLAYAHELTDREGKPLKYEVI